jgi:hypothetical protein
MDNQGNLYAASPPAVCGLCELPGVGIMQLPVLARTVLHGLVLLGTDSPKEILGKTLPTLCICDKEAFAVGRVYGFTALLRGQYGRYDTQ